MSAADTVTALYRQCVGDALDAGYDDFDAALLKNVPSRSSRKLSPPTCTSKEVSTAFSSDPGTATSWTCGASTNNPMTRASAHTC
ncbi:hypothetical protein [Kocuria aegyptia]|uniref:hypothetical protein n=1 Tax=Kocuria aegyptia TaxID=330943 RepID=UPI0031D30190